MPTNQRIYSFLVHGFRAVDGKREDMREARVVAYDSAEAIEKAKELLAPAAEHHIDLWLIAAVGEIAPKEAREWIAWHAVVSERRTPLRVNGNVAPS